MKIIFSIIKLKKLLPKKVYLIFLSVNIVYILTSICEIFMIFSLSRSLFYTDNLNDSINILSLTRDQFIYLSILFVFLTGFFRTLTLYFNTKFSSYVSHIISKLLFNNLLFEDFSLTVKRSVSDTINLLSYGGRFASNIGMPLLQACSSLINILILTFSIIIIEPRNFLIVGSLTFLGYLLATYLTKNYFSKSNTSADELNFKSIEYQREVLQSKAEIILLNRADAIRKKYSQIDKELREITGKVTFLTGLPKFIIESIGIFSILLLLLPESKNYTLKLQAISLLAITLQRLLPQIQQIYQAFSALVTNNYILQAIIINLDNKPNTNFLKFTSKFSRKNLFNISDGKFNLIAREMSLEKNSQLILEKINVNISGKGFIAIVGESGCGKSTLLEAFCGLISPSYGELKLYKNETNFIKSDEKNKWMHNVSYCPQKPYILNASLKENITYRCEIKDFKLLKKVMSICMVDELNNELKKREFSKKRMDFSSSISGGQAQRIALARACMKLSPILLLDESTSAVDPKIENKILKGIKSLRSNMLTICVTHKLESLRYNYDKIIFLRNKKIEAIGNYDLLLKNKHFRNFIKSQESNEYS